MATRSAALSNRSFALVLAAWAVLGCNKASHEGSAASASASATAGQQLCRDSEAECKAFGRCTGTIGHCTATSDEDCRKASVCAQSGWCVAKDGKCEVPAGSACQNDRCSEYAECTKRGGACVVGSEADCKQSGICRRGGQCSFRGGKCVIASDADCAGSWRCTRYGFCKYESGKCVK
jgi:hypothetical protein